MSLMRPTGSKLAISDHIISAKVNALFHTLQETSSNLSTCDDLLEEYTHKILNSNLTQSSYRPKLTRDSSTQTDFTHHYLPVDQCASEHSVATDSLDSEISSDLGLIVALTKQLKPSTSLSSLQLADSESSINEGTHINVEQNALSVISSGSIPNILNENEAGANHTVSLHSPKSSSFDVHPAIKLPCDEDESQACSVASELDCTKSEAINSCTVQKQKQVGISSNNTPQKVDSDSLYYESVTNEVRSVVLEELKNLRVDIVAANKSERSSLEGRLEEINGYFQQLDARISASRLYSYNVACKLLMHE